MSRSLERAEKQVTKAAEQVDAWKGRQSELLNEVKIAESRIGNDALASGDLEASAAKLSALRDQANAAGETVRAAEAQLEEARREHSLAEAKDLRVDAEKLDKEAHAHRARTEELLSALQDHEGGRYVPEQPQPGVASDLRYWTPRSEQLRARARAARERAIKLERKQAQSSNGNAQLLTRSAA